MCVRLCEAVQGRARLRKDVYGCGRPCCRSNVNLPLPPSSFLLLPPPSELVRAREESQENKRGAAEAGRQLASTQLDVARLEKGKESLDESLQRCQGLLDAETDKVVALEDEVNTLTCRVEGMEAEVEAKGREVEGGERVRGVITTDLEAAVAERDVLTKEVNAHLQTIDEANRTVATLQKTVETLTRKEEAARGEAETKTGRLAEVEEAAKAAEAVARGVQVRE